MPFLTDLIVKPIRGTEKRVLLSPLIYQTKDDVEICVFRGFITDFATVPQAVRNIIDQDSGGIRDAAVVHDYLYIFGEEFTRKECDVIFYEAMRELGMTAWKALKVYLAVRLFGGKYWRKPMLSNVI